MVILVHREHHLAVEHFLHRVGSHPEIEHQHLSGGLGELLACPVDGRKVKFGISGDLRLADLGVQFQHIHAGSRLLAECFDIFRLRIDRHQRIVYRAEMQRIRRLAEDREMIVDFLVKDGNRRQGLRVFHQVTHAGTIVVHIRLGKRGTVGSIIRGIHLLEEIAELLLYLLQPGAFFGPFDGPAAQRIRNDRHLFSLRKQEGSNPVSVVIKVDESGLALFHLDLAGVAAILVRPDGIEHLDRRPFQTADGDLVIRHGALQGTPDGCLVAGNRQGGGEQPRQNYVKSFHML